MVFRNLFGKTQTAPGAGPDAAVLTGPRIPRHSSGWFALLKHLKTDPGMRILDIGPTSSTNINFLTSLGHGVYMADLVNESLRGNWQVTAEGDSESRFDVEGFLDQNMDFSGRDFDVILAWTTLDYVPEALIGPLVQRFRASMNPGGRILAYFHTRDNGATTPFCRYHVADGENLEVQETTASPVQRVITNRNIERLFEAYSNLKFFLAKDNLNEVIITR